jgi:hypothetical protein
MVPRLPITGQDEGIWGDVLNQFLTVSHNADGTLRGAAVTAAGGGGATSVADGSITTAKLADNAVTNAKLDAPTQAILSSVSSRYAKPAPGIPITDLTSAVQTSLSKADTAIQPSSLAVVATTGAYADLTSKPTIPTINSGVAASRPSASAYGIGTWYSTDTASLDYSNGTNWTTGIAGSSGGSGSGALVATYNGTNYPLRSTLTSSATAPVEWRGPIAPTIGSGYMLAVDIWVNTGAII